MPPHYARTVRQYLHQILTQRWFGRRGSIERPPRSPDLTLMGFFSWRVVNNQVYKRNPHTVNELKDYISDALTEIDGDLYLCRMCVSVLDWYEDCCKVEGGHFDHLRD